jgi:ribosomal protein L37AE/L43A
MKSYKPHCRNCDEEYATDRWKLGYKHCMPCGEKLSHDAVRTIVPMHKSNYMMITNMADLKGINNKGGFHNGL